MNEPAPRNAEDGLAAGGAATDPTATTRRTDVPATRLPVESLNHKHWTTLDATGLCACWMALRGRRCKAVRR